MSNPHRRLLAVAALLTVAIGFVAWSQLSAGNNEAVRPPRSRLIARAETGEPRPTVAEVAAPQTIGEDPARLPAEHRGPAGAPSVDPPENVTPNPPPDDRPIDTSPATPQSDPVHAAAPQPQPRFIAPPNLPWHQWLSVAEDGPINLDEWQAAGGQEEVFRRLDQDGDGFVTHDELTTALSTVEKKTHESPIAAPATAPSTPRDGGEVERQPASAETTAIRPSNLPANRRRRGNTAIATGGKAVVSNPVAPAPRQSQPAAQSTPQSKAAAKAEPAPAKKPITRFDDDALAVTPLPLDEGWNAYWVARNQQNLDRLAAGEQARVLFLGDSLTDLLSTGPGKPLWDKYFEPLGAANFAVGGATTSQVLWQIEQGQVAKLSPELIVLLIGSNNLSVGQSPVAAANGITKVVNELQQRLPQTKILLLGVLPRAERASDPIRAGILEVNRSISALNDGHALRYLDFGGRLLARDGTLPTRIMPDSLHPNLTGYQIYMSAVWPMVKSMLD